MDKTEAIRVAGKYIKKASEKYIISKAVLFGSYAKGTNHKDSDIDIAIISKDIKDVVDMQYELMKLKRGIDLRIEPHPFREKDFVPSNPIVSEILNSGLTIR